MCVSTSSATPVSLGRGRTVHLLEGAAKVVRILERHKAKALGLAGPLVLDHLHVQGAHTLFLMVTRENVRAHMPTHEPWP